MRVSSSSCSRLGLAIHTTLVALVGLFAAAPAHAEPLLRGPHPFLKENALSFAGGLSAGSGGAIGGLRAHLNYGYQLAGGLWLDLQIGLVDGNDAPADRRPCPSCGYSAEVLAGLAYRLRMNLPIVPYGKLAAGPLYLFPASGGATAGLLTRPAAGAKYYLYDWLGFGIELGAMLGVAGQGGDANRAPIIGALEVTAGAEWQF